MCVCLSLSLSLSLSRSSWVVIVSWSTAPKDIALSQLLANEGLARREKKKALMFGSSLAGSSVSFLFFRFLSL